jgi:hypothetical protein
VGYVSSNPRRDGKWRRIAIQTTGRSMLIRHRPGYYAASAGPDAVSGASLPRMMAKDPR